MSGALLIQCAWCLRLLGTRPDCLSEKGTHVSHTICQECLERIEGKSNQQESDR